MTILSVIVALPAFTVSIVTTTLGLCSYFTSGRLESLWLAHNYIKKSSVLCKYVKIVGPTKSVTQNISGNFISDFNGCLITMSLLGSRNRYENDIP